MSEHCTLCVTDELEEVHFKKAILQRMAFFFPLKVGDQLFPEVLIGFSRRRVWLYSIQRSPIDTHFFDIGVVGNAPGKDPRALAEFIDNITMHFFSCFNHGKKCPDF